MVEDGCRSKGRLRRPDPRAVLARKPSQNVTVISEYETINRLLKFAKPKNNWASLPFRGVG
jgi:hypothetical protein